MIGLVAPSFILLLAVTKCASLAPTRALRRSPCRLLAGPDNARTDAPKVAPSVPSFGPALGAAQPPDVLKRLRVGESVLAFRQGPSPAIGGGPGWNVTVTRVSAVPDAFLLKGLVGAEERAAVIAGAEEAGLRPAETQSGGGGRSKCGVSWFPSSSPVPGTLARAAGRLLLSPEALASPGVGCEDLQVLEYQEQGGFVLHHDGVPRVLTVIYYLNGVAGTWFPLAQVREGPWQSSAEGGGAAAEIPRNLDAALRLASRMTPGIDGLLVAGPRNTSQEASSSAEGGPGDLDPGVVFVEAGDALAFYGYRNGAESGYSSASSASSASSGGVAFEDFEAMGVELELEWRALHAGLPVGVGPPGAPAVTGEQAAAAAAQAAANGGLTTQPAEELNQSEISRQNKEDAAASALQTDSGETKWIANHWFHAGRARPQ